jgi:hypothetical protein
MEKLEKIKSLLQNLISRMIKLYLFPEMKMNMNTLLL